MSDFLTNFIYYMSLVNVSWRYKKIYMRTLQLTKQYVLDLNKHDHLFNHNLYNLPMYTSIFNRLLILAGFLLKETFWKWHIKGDLIYVISSTDSSSPFFFSFCSSSSSLLLLFSTFLIYSRISQLRLTQLSQASTKQNTATENTDHNIPKQFIHP